MTESHIHSPNTQIVPWCTEILDNPQRLADLFSLLGKRERRRKPRYFSQSQNAYRTDEASIITNRPKNRYVKNPFLLLIVFTVPLYEYWELIAVLPLFVGVCLHDINS